MNLNPKDGKLTKIGILNLTPDSFSDGGKYTSANAALQKVEELKKRGINFIDIGAEATGPNSQNVSAEEELKRLLPILQELRSQRDITISIDTYKAQVAREALQNGAHIINDITALRGDTEMAKVIAEFQCPLIMMYSKDPTARTSIQEQEYANVIKDIKDFLIERIKYAKEQGIKDKQIIIDPGMGHYISANPKYSYEIIARLSELKELGYPILVGISRKSFLGGNMEEREIKAQALEEIIRLNGASYLRIH